MFRNREEAGLLLAQKLHDRQFRDALVLAIPRGGVVVGAVLARELAADFDVILSRKLRAPEQPELSIGAVSEEGFVYLTPENVDSLANQEDYLGQERSHQQAEIDRQRTNFRDGRLPVPMTGRSIIVVDDGVATGSTLAAALRVIHAHHPYEVLVAVPVAPPEAVLSLQGLCNEVVCLLSPSQFWAIGQFYEDFSQVSDEKVIRLLRAHAELTSSSPR